MLDLFLKPIYSVPLGSNNYFITSYLMMSFTGTDTYIATRELQIAVNAAIHLQKPLIVKRGTRNRENAAWHMKLPERWTRIF